MKNNTIDSKLLSAKVALENALNNDHIKTELALYGYDETALNVGLALYEDAEQKHSAQKKEYGDQYAASDSFNTALDTANALYMRHVKIARVALRNNRGAAASLEIDGRRKKTYSGWIKQAAIFYTNALADTAVQTALTKFGITTEVLNEGKAAVSDVESKLAAQLKEKGEAQNATEARDQALEDLMDWMADFIAISRIAMETNPQYLETLGIVEPS